MNNAAHAYRRRRRFIDKMIQGKLLWILICIEMLLFGIAMIIIYQDLHIAIQDRMYRVHQTEMAGRPLFFKELLMILPWIIAINVFLVVMVERRWKQIVRNIINQLVDILYRVKRLDLRIYPILHTDHEVLQTAKQWMDKERDRNASLQSKLNQLPQKVDLHNSAELHQVRECLKSMSRLLPDS